MLDAPSDRISNDMPSRDGENFAVILAMPVGMENKLTNTGFHSHAHTG